MELNYLREFVVLARTCQFQETAEELFISQSSLSKHIKSMEKELGQDLLKRSTRRVELTDFGREFLPYATEIATLQAEYTNKLLSGGGTRRFVIGIAPNVTLFSINAFLKAFSQDHPGYKIEFEENSDDELRAMLGRGECDLIIVSCNDEADRTGLASIPYTSDYLVALVSPECPLTKKGVATLDDILKYPMVQRGHTNFARLISETAPPAAFSVSRGSLMIDMVDKGTAIAIYPHYGALHYLKHAPEANVTMIDIEPRTMMHMEILYPKVRRNSVLARALEKYLTKK